MNTNGLKVLFCSADNSIKGGSFLSMVGLATVLRDLHGIKPYIALPCEGDGIQLLNKNDLDYVCIPSYGWGWPMQCKKTFLGKAYKYGEKKRTIHASALIADYIRSNGIELVHINSSAVYVGALAANKARVPYVWHIREFLCEGLNMQCLWPRLERRLYKEAAAILTISNALQNYALKQIPNPKIVYVGNAVDHLDEKLGRPIFQSRKTRFAMVGTITKNKGQPLMLEAVKILKSEYKRSDFIVYVVGVDSCNFKQSIQINELDGLIEYLGTSDRVPAFLSMIDSYLMCSMYEGFGRVTAEAMSSGACVIGVASGGTTDMIFDNLTGYLIPPNDPYALAQKMLFVMDNPEAASFVARNGQKYIRDHFTYQKNAKAVVEVYKDI